MGYNEVYRLTGLAAVAQVSDRDLASYGISGPRLRENSLLTALISETLADDDDCGEPGTVYP